MPHMRRHRKAMNNRWNKFVKSLGSILTTIEILLIIIVVQNCLICFKDGGK